MTTDELKTRLKQINPDLKLGVGIDNEPMGIWYTVSKYYDHDDLELFRIDENDYYFEPIINEIYEANSLIGSDTVKEVGDLLFKYFEPELSKESQKISNDSKNQNGSTAAFSKLASKDSQKKTKEQLIYDFIDEIADHNFKATQTMTLHKTSSISIKADEVGTPCLNMYLTGILDDRIPENPIQIKADDINEKSSSQLGWLLNRASKLVSDLRGKENED